MNELVILVVGVGGLAVIASNLHFTINPQKAAIVTRHARIHPVTRFKGTDRVANKRSDTKGVGSHQGDITTFRGQHIRDRKAKGLINYAGRTKIFDEMFRQQDFVSYRMKKGRASETLNHRYRL